MSRNGVTFSVRHIHRRLRFREAPQRQCAFSRQLSPRQRLARLARIAGQSHARRQRQPQTTRATVARRDPADETCDWKYELARTPPGKLAKASWQMQENRTDACVLNGQAYGSSFVFCRPTQHIHECRNKTELVQFLTTWLTGTLRLPVACVR